MARTTYPCRSPRCPSKLPRPGYCPDHQQQGSGWEARIPKHRRHGPSPYGSEWTAIRNRVLAEEPTCRICMVAPSVEVDHSTPLAEGGTHERSNLRGVCARCHKRETHAQSTRARFRHPP